MIMDYLLDGNGYLNNMNGLELLKRIKKLIPKLDVIVLSCQNNIKVVKDFMRAGIREYIKKEGLGQHKVKQFVGEAIQKWEEKDRHKDQLTIAGLILGLVTLVSVLVYSLT